MSNVAFLAHPAWLGIETVMAFVAGTCVGFAHFDMLREIANIFIAAGSPLRLIALYLARFLATGAVLYLAGRIGALPLLASLAGVVAAREFVVRRSGAAP